MTRPRPLRRPLIRDAEAATSSTRSHANCWDFQALTPFFQFIWKSRTGPAPRSLVLTSRRSPRSLPPAIRPVPTQQLSIRVLPVRSQPPVPCTRQPPARPTHRAGCYGARHARSRSQFRMSTSGLPFSIDSAPPIQSAHRVFNRPVSAKLPISILAVFLPFCEPCPMGPHLAGSRPRASLPQPVICCLRLLE